MLLAEIEQPIVVFVDEIDSLFKYGFNDDFFALIRSFYQERSEHEAYRRLSFVLLGVATPGDLIRDKRRTSFNIGGRLIDLKGFEPGEVGPLKAGLVERAENPAVVLREILQWTGGQPFLTQRLCELIATSSFTIAAGSEEALVGQLVRSRIIDDWEAQDVSVHLKTIRDRLLANETRSGRLLGLYQRILQRGEVPADGSDEQIELRLSGLIREEQNSLRVANPIYAAVFGAAWIDAVLLKLRPYGAAIAAWLATGRKDKSRLLRGQALKDALIWANESRSLGDEDRLFLSASQTIEQAETQTRLEAEAEANRILSGAREQAEAELVAANEQLTETQVKTEELVEKGQKTRKRTALIAGVAIALATLATVWGGQRGLEASTAQQAADKSREETRATEREKAEIELAMGATEQDLQRAEQKVETAEKKLQTADEKAREAELIAQGAEEVAKEAQMQVQTAQGQLESVNAEKQQVESQAKQARVRAQTARQESEAATLALQKVEEEVKEANRKIEDANAQVNKAHEDLRQAEEDLRNTSDENAALTDSVDAAAALLKEIHAAASLAGSEGNSEQSSAIVRVDISKIESGLASLGRVVDRTGMRPFVGARDNTNADRTGRRRSGGSRGNTNALSTTQNDSLNFTASFRSRVASRNFGGLSQSGRDLSSSYVQISAGDTIALTIDNDESSSLYFSVLVADASGEINVLFPSSATDYVQGINELQPGRTHTQNLLAVPPFGDTKLFVIATNFPFDIESTLWPFLSGQRDSFVVSTSSLEKADALIKQAITSWKSSPNISENSIIDAIEISAGIIDGNSKDSDGGH